jgi:predicted dehydrogenase
MARRAARTGPVNVALVGQQFMGRAHSNAWGQVNRFFDPPRPAVLHVVAGRDTRTLPGFAQRWGWERWTARWEELAADPLIELVDLGTPNHLHREQAVTLLHAGKHVACEKPLAGTLADARAMRDAAAAARGQHTFVWFNYRRCPAVALAWQLVREGRLGPIRHVRARYLQSWGGPSVPLTWRFQKKLAGSGAHGDLNAHIVDMARFLVGEEITEVHGAVARTFITERALPGAAGGGSALDSGLGAGRGKGRGKSDVDDCVLFLASFTGGATASFEATRLAEGHLNDNGIELNGEKASLRFDFEDMNVLHLHEAGPDGRRTAGWRRIMVTAPEHPYVGHFWPEAHVIGYEHAFINMAADILGVLAGGKPLVPLPDFADAYETQRVLEAALISAKERCAVRMKDVR